MKLEQRVQVLEQEVQVLKNQIQATLLAIQEHLLVNTHPTLRADELSLPPAPARPQTTRPAAADVAEMVEKQEKVAAPALVRKVSFEETNPTPASFNPVVEEAPAINVRKVQLDDLHTTPAPAWQQAAALPANEYDEDAWNENAWQSVSSPVMPNAPRQPAYQSERFEEQITPMTPPFVTETNWQNLNELEEWACQKVDQIGVKRTKKLIANYAKQGRMTTEEKEALLKFVSVYGTERHAKANGSSDHDTLISLTTAKQARAANGRAVRNGEEPRQNLILRLIAGVQNAGIADRSKRHG